MRTRRPWLVPLVAAALSALAFFPFVADFVYPGESAAFVAYLNGLGSHLADAHPLLSPLARPFGGSNFLAPWFGVIATVALSLLARRTQRGRGGDLAAIVTAAVFVLTPAVRLSATHLEPRLFVAAWAALAALVAHPVGFGLLWGAGLVESPLFLALLPLVLVRVTASAKERGWRPWVGLAAFLLSFAFAYALAGRIFGGGLHAVLAGTWRQLCGYVAPDGWMLVVLVATLPFCVTRLAAHRPAADASLSSHLFHVGVTILTVLALATKLSPSELAAPYGVLPVPASAFVALTTGYLAAYWWQQSVAGARRLLARAILVVTSVVLALSLAMNLLDFRPREGAFADEFAGRVLADMDGRTVLVANGLVDDHLLLKAAEGGNRVKIVQLARDLDRDYLDRLAAQVRETGIGGERNADLALSASIGVMPFLRDWLGADTNAVAKTAVMGIDDLWLAVGAKPVPEALFSGADPARKTADVDWPTYRRLLPAPAKWGSARLYRERDPVKRLRLDLRRYLGLVANNRGVHLMDSGDRDGAFRLFALVTDEIDSDNVSAVCNMMELAENGHPAAKARLDDCRRRIAEIERDKTRRYRVWALAGYYGYIRNPEFFSRLSHVWARSGRPGEALGQVLRAADLLPSDRRNTYMNLVASLYADENDRMRSRAVLERILEKDADNHDALVGMMRLKFSEGDAAGAERYLARAVTAAGDDPRAGCERAMLAMLRGELADAEKTLLARVADDSGDIRAWALLAAVLMQETDEAVDPKRREELAVRLEKEVLPAMQGASRDADDYYVHSVRAFMLMRQGADRRREARDAFIAAAEKRPDAAAVREAILRLDVSLDDPAAAEAHARLALRHDRKSPMANYVLGSLALAKGDLAAAERHLRVAADAKPGVTMAMNDLAEAMRRTGRFAEAERYARMAVRTDPRFYVAWETLGSVILEAKGDLSEAEACVRRACDLSRDGVRATDVRMLVTLARVQVAKGEGRLAKTTLAKVASRLAELSEGDRRVYEETLRAASGGVAK